MHFVNDLAFHFQTGPVCVRPRKRRWIDNTGGAVRAVRLKSGGRIGMKMFGPVSSKAIKRSRADVGNAGKITPVFSFQRVKCSLRILFRALFQNKIDMLRFRRPDTEVCFIRSDKFGADRVATFCELSHATLSPTSAALAVHESDFAFHPKIDN